MALLLPGPPHQSTCGSEPWSGSRRRHPVVSRCLSGSGLCAVWPAPGLTSNSSGWTAPAVGRQRAAVTGQGLGGASCRSLPQSSMAEYGAAARVDPWLRLCPARPVFPFPRFPPLACLYSCCKPSVLHWTARRVLLKPGEPHPSFALRYPQGSHLTRKAKNLDLLFPPEPVHSLLHPSLHLSFYCRGHAPRIPPRQPRTHLRPFHMLRPPYSPEPRSTHTVTPSCHLTDITLTRPQF